MDVDDMMYMIAANQLRHDPGSMADHMDTVQNKMDPKALAAMFVQMGPPYDPSELDFIHRNCDEPFEHDWEYADDWRDDVVDKYAKHIQNYYYNYKPEAKAIDPSIDPEQKQIGPMAQDIEKVNPSVVDDSQGAKLVDANKLALMNAGAIAELARRMQEMKGGA